MRKKAYRLPIASSGFSLMEFLVASVLSMIVLIAVGSGYYSARKVNDVALARLDVQQNLRNASNMIVRDARMAGSFGCFNMADASNSSVYSDIRDNSLLQLKPKSTEQLFLVPIKTGSLGINGFNAEALAFQYGVGYTPVSIHTNDSVTLSSAADFKNGAPIAISSCHVLDRPSEYKLSGQNITDINPSISTSHVDNELSVMRYTVNAYVVGKPSGGEQGLYRIQLGNNGNWLPPQLLMPGITSMSVSYGYADCPDGTSASNTSESFVFENKLRTGINAKTPALIRITLNDNSLAVKGKIMDAPNSPQSAGNVHIYNIEAAVRGGSLCVSN